MSALEWHIACFVVGFPVGFAVSFALQARHDTRTGRRLPVDAPVPVVLFDPADTDGGN